MKTLTAGLFIGILCNTASASAPFRYRFPLFYNTADSAYNRPAVVAVRAVNPINVDGLLTESEWQRPGVTDFTERDPNEGAKPSQKTEVWVAYDDAALYVAARMYDTSPDSIIRRIGRRDADITADAFYVGIDSYHDRRTGFYFVVSAGGSVADGTCFNDSWDDNSWDGVWDAATTIDSLGWTLEIKIPYSQLRFPQQDEYVWGINFIRQIERSKERYDFVMVPKKESGWVSHFADLTGLRNIHPPRKLELLPYTVSSAKSLRHDEGDPFKNGYKFNQNFGADLKLGLGYNLTLNATINPDFGQVEVDPAVVNLTQYETYFIEKRPFFVEGSNFFDFGFGGTNNNWGFNFGNPEYFYSRRIGRSPEGEVQHSGFTDIPDRTHIIGAAKLTGKIADGWSLGALQALTAREYAETDSSAVRFKDVVEPFTYYGVLRSLREFNEGHQALGIIGTAVARDFNRDYLADNFNHRSYAIGMDGWTNLDAERMWVVTGWLSATRVEGTSGRMLSLQQSSLHYYQRPDAGYLGLDTSASSLSGYGGRVAINKQKGNSYLNAAIGTISPGFDSNDLGFMFRTDIINAHLVLGYSWYEPDGIFRRKGFNIATFTSYNYGGIRVGEGYFIFANLQLMNYWSLSGNASFHPPYYDPYTTRGGPLMQTTKGSNGYLQASTDSRQPVVFNLGIGGAQAESGGYDVTLEGGIEWKPSSGLNIKFFPSIEHTGSYAQWITQVDDPNATATYGARYVFARIDQRQVSANIRVDWTFTPKLTLQLFLQPLISVGTYDDFREFREPGTFTFNRYGENGSTISFIESTNQYLVDPDGTGPTRTFSFDNPDFNFKSLRGNAILRWEYLPGSTLYFVWTQERTNEADAGDFSFGRDFHNMISSSGDNVFLIKATYWWNP